MARPDIHLTINAALTISREVTQLLERAGNLA